jgi:hypothetical protein
VQVGCHGAFLCMQGWVRCHGSATCTEFMDGAGSKGSRTFPAAHAEPGPTHHAQSARTFGDATTNGINGHHHCPIRAHPTPRDTCPGS